MKDAFGKMDRREFLKKAAIGGTTLVGLGIIGCAPAAPPTPAKPAGAPAPSVAELVEGAKKEGTIMNYSIGPEDAAQMEKDAFSKKYPFIKYELYVGTGEAISEKVGTEARAGKSIADIVVAGTDDIYQFQKTDLLQAYDSPERKNFPKELVDTQGRWTVRHYEPHVMTYNTKLVPPERAPKNFDDLADPWWKGKLGIESQCWEWFSYMLLIRGQEKGLDLMRKLAANKPRLQKGHTALAKLVEAGEVPAAIMVYQISVQRMMDSGSPVKWVAVNPTTTSATNVAIVKNAPHPNAARLLVDFMLSLEGQQLIAKERRIPTRQGVKADPPSLTEGVQYFPPSITIGDEIRKNQKTFSEIFGAM